MLISTLSPFLRCFVAVGLLACTVVVASCSGSENTNTNASPGSEVSGELQDAPTTPVTPTTPTTPTVPTPPNALDDQPDPLNQNTTRVQFDIEVPAYQSNELQVNIQWGEEQFSAAWVGDEMWSATAELPTDTEHSLVVIFSDGNGEVTLASYEQAFKTGINEAEDITVLANQFDSDKWDSDSDGVSNLAELKAGSVITETPTVLLFSETLGYRHDSIPDALAAIKEIASAASIEIALAADSTGVFTSENLANYDAVVWVLTSGDVLNDEEQTAFETYIKSGGGYVGIHAASDTEYDWPWYGQLVGAYFDRHPQIQVATQNVEDQTHVSTQHLGTTWTRTDEWYDYSWNPRASVNVLLTLDESTYVGGVMGADHPSAWYHDFDGGRAWYTGGGHTAASYTEPDFRTHLLGGLRYAIGAATAE